jgi:hypothetical protein
MTKGRRPARDLRVVLAALLAAAATAAPSFAANIGITWLDMSPTAFNSTVPNNSVFNVPGIGNVTVIYSIPSHWTQARSQNPSFTAGSVVSGPDTYAWTNYEHFGTIFTPGNLGPESGTVTYIFPSLLPAGSVFIGTIGLGATTVNQNGTFLGDYVPVVGFGPTQFIGGANTFTLQNSLTGAGGADPWWNTYLGVVRIDDAVQSIVVQQSQLRGDGIGVNVGFYAPGVPVQGSAWSRIKGLYR